VLAADGAALMWRSGHAAETQAYLIPIPGTQY